ncbi:hypothetical protein [Phycisphaera mikurensis]|uniref:Uncharacterized protein n=1 Tax=Phycisphaera mikurensis (strain NBRC 102666 / KCTC 22515 / FYK2301M01) TaxID=1142394 RepID=I0IF32_PHYMF|nr:hypothetical protein [Phycisphaera mikurensis]MBB6441661.1 hypothetical protein [Phycisphaera mikurensis]BAM03870.1 hypothetical protein PSMK_17110 [Phycisphaera mikurensis NBRC 102666]
MPLPRTPLPLPLALLAVALPALHTQEARGSEGDPPARFSPAALAERNTEVAGRSAIPQPGEGFPAPLAFETRAPVKIPFVAEGQVVPWEEAAGYVGGDRIVVQGTIVDTYQVNNGPCLLKFDAKDRDAFLIAAFLEGAPGLAAPPAELYRGKVVRVSGPVTPYKGNPQIVVSDPSQIEIVGVR